MQYLGWIVAAFLGGFLLASQRQKKRLHRPQTLAKVESFEGRHYWEICLLAGDLPKTVTLLADGKKRKVWQEQGYTIALDFDEMDVCLGVEEERYEN